jgi:hypothetical protein
MSKKTFLHKSDFYAFLGILVLLFGFYPELFFARSASLTGDHSFQHYPWGYLLAQSLRHFHFPFWTDLVQSGFPLVAEGQVGAFYPVNLALYLLLPFQWAYAYMNCVHFVIAGLGMYFYLRAVKLTPHGAFMASAVYLFGAAYGGAYYNITSLKTLAWFPWMLFSFEKFNKTKRKRYFLFLILSMAMALLAGYLQIAVLAVLIFFLYSMLRIFVFKKQSDFKNKLNLGLFLFGSFGVACLIALPQLLLTVQLASYSNRVNLAEDYAYVGSMSPLALVTFVYPVLTSLFRGNNLYLGIGSLFLIILALSSRQVRKEAVVRTWITLGIISFFLALGEWSPLYVALIKLSHFYSFRTPAKFLFFICFAGSVLAGYGFNFLLTEKKMPESKTIKNAVSVFAYVVAVYCVGFLAVHWNVSRGWLIQFGNWFAEHFVYGRAGHPHSLEVYHSKVLGLLDYAKLIMAQNKLWVPWNHLTVLATTGIVLGFWKNKKVSLPWILAFVLLVDLYAISFFDLKRDFHSYQNIGQLLSQEGKVTDRLLQEKRDGAVSRVHAFWKPGHLLPQSPSFNMFDEMYHTGMYSPFVFARYFETIGQLGGVNDSNTVFTPDSSYILERLPLLNFMNISHIVTSHFLDHPALSVLVFDEKESVYLYRNRSRHSRIHFLTEYQAFDDWQTLKNEFMRSDFDPAQVLLLEKGEAEKILETTDQNQGRVEFWIQSEALKDNVHKWTVKINRSCFFVVSDLMYPGWQVRVNNKPVPMLNAYGLFRAAQLPEAGVYEIEFRYVPFG